MESRFYRPYAGKTQRDDRMSLVLRMEWVLLSLRYVIYVILAFATIIIDDQEWRNKAFLIGGLALVHNLFAHWVFFSKRYSIFTSLWNFIVYLVLCCLLVGFTGGASSPLALVFVFLVIGVHIYVPHTPSSLWITLIVCAAYSFTVIGDWIFSGMHWSNFPVYVNLFFIAFAGWITGILARLFAELEKKAQMKAAAQASSESILRAILNHTGHPILVYDENEIITEVNESACNFLGLPREKIIGMRFQTFIFDDGSLSEILETLKQTGHLHQEMLVICSNSQERSVYMHVHSFLNEGRRFFVALFHDITHQKELEAAHRQAKLNLERANQELQRVVDLRAAFYINIANRLRSPLAAILGFTDMLLNEQLGELTEDQRKALASNRRSLMRIFELLDEAYTLESSLETEEQPRHELFVDLGAGI